MGVCWRRVSLDLGGGMLNPGMLNPGMLNRMLKFLHVSGDGIRHVEPGELGWNPNGANVAWNLLDTMSTLLIDAIGGE